MYLIQECDINELKHLKNGKMTICQTYEWVVFLQKNQNATPVLLKIIDNNKIVAYFVGLVITKLGIKILGSPFEGWLTPDMGFIEIEVLNYNEALKVLADYAFDKLDCYFVQIIDKKIRSEMLSNDIYTLKNKTLYLHVGDDIETVLANFTKNGRRDVRASSRKKLEIKQVPFSDDFVVKYYNQLLDVFAKQNLKPFYKMDKIKELAQTFEEKPDRFLALEAHYEGKCIATVFSAGFGNWAYYIGAASTRGFQKNLPNEALFWEFIKIWHKRGIRNFDLVGYRKYKMKYNPEVVCVPVIIFSKYKILLSLKNIAKSLIKILRLIKGKYSTDNR